VAKSLSSAAVNSRDPIRQSERNSEMPTEVASTEYGVLIHYDDWNTLELKWLPTTKDATEAEARDTGSSSWTPPSSSTGGPTT
jgi:hypothetical protein